MQGENTLHGKEARGIRELIKARVVNARQLRESKGDKK
jgi:hypothetical protein